MLPFSDNILFLLAGFSYSGLGCLNLGLALNCHGLLRELVGMSGAPFSPQRDDDGLDDAYYRGDEKRAQDAEEFSASDQGGDGNDGVQSNGVSDDAWPNDMTLNGVYAEEIYQDYNSEQPALHV